MTFCWPSTFVFRPPELETAEPALWEVVATMEPKLDMETLRVPAKLYRIGELVGYTPFSRQTIHNYTIMGLIHKAEWTEGGQRPRSGAVRWIVRASPAKPRRFPQESTSMVKLNSGAAGPTMGYMGNSRSISLIICSSQRLQMA